MASFAILHKKQLFTVLVDDEHYDRVLDAGPWHLSIGKRGNNHVYRVLYEPGAPRSAKNRRVYEGIHRFILGTAAECVDHVNADGLDNRTRNLRPATIAENNRNKRRHLKNASGYKGVHFHPQSGRWRARIMVNRVTHELGLHNTAEAAHLVYCEAARRLHGEFWRAA